MHWGEAAKIAEARCVHGTVRRRSGADKRERGYAYPWRSCGGPLCYGNRGVLGVARMVMGEGCEQSTARARPYPIRSFKTCVTKQLIAIRGWAACQATPLKGPGSRWLGSMQVRGVRGQSKLRAPARSRNQSVASHFSPLSTGNPAWSASGSRFPEASRLRKTTL